MYFNQVHASILRKLWFILEGRGKEDYRASLEFLPEAERLKVRENWSAKTLDLSIEDSALGRRSRQFLLGKNVPVKVSLYKMMPSRREETLMVL